MKIKDMQRGQIWWFSNPQMQPCPKDKFSICIGSSQFLAINTKGCYGRFKLTKKEYPFLNYDSYVGDSILDFSGEDEEIEVPNANFRQIISDETAKQLINHVKKAPVLKKTDKDIITAALVPPFHPPIWGNQKLT